MNGKRSPSGRLKQAERVFLVVVDDSEEMPVALRYAALRARATGGRVALFSVIEPIKGGDWQAVKELAEHEARQAAEARMAAYSDQIMAESGKMPVIYIRIGNPRDALLALLDEEPTISILVLAAGTSSRGPGPLIEALTGKFYSKLKIPMTIVPGTLADEDINALT